MWVVKCMWYGDEYIYIYIYIYIIVQLFALYAF
jgi:hypothetical protein